MTTSTELIVLSKTNYSESSIVVQCFSREYGRVGLLVTGVKKRKSKIKLALFEPLSILEVHGNFQSSKGLVIPKEIRVTVPLQLIHGSMLKRSLTFFLSEVIYKSLKEADADVEIFQFLQSGIEFLNYTIQPITNFHIMFLLKFTRFLGFQPRVSAGGYLDIYEGNFSNSITSGAVYFDERQKEMLSRFFGLKFDQMDVLSLTNNDRKFFIDFILAYFNAHIPNMGTVKSHLILEEILH